HGLARARGRRKRRAGVAGARRRARPADRAARLEHGRLPGDSGRAAARRRGCRRHLSRERRGAAARARRRPAELRRRCRGARCARYLNSPLTVLPAPSTARPVAAPVRLTALPTPAPELRTPLPTPPLSLRPIAFVTALTVEPIPAPVLATVVPTELAAPPTIE